MRLSRRCATVIFKGGEIPSQDSISYSQYTIYNRLSFRNYLLPFLLAVMFHGVIFYLSFYSPLNFFRRANPVEVFSVNLFSVTDVPPQIVPKFQPKQDIENPPDTDAKPKAPPISLSPQKIKRKNLKNKQEALKRENILSKRLASLRAEQEAQKAQEEAKEAARSAVAQLAHAMKGRVSQQSGIAASNGSSSMRLSEAQREYLAGIHSHILNKWKVPDLPNIEDTLEAIVVLKVDNQGKIVKSFFEKKTDNLYFNKSIEKAINDADPLPPPDVFKEMELEIGLRFRPGEVF